jgi:hypothetical protein
MGKKMNTIQYPFTTNGCAQSEKEFLEKARFIHGDAYDYSKVDYKNAQRHVILICKKAGHTFTQRPMHHVKGTGCPKCKNKKLTQEEFITLSTAKFGPSMFNYSQVKYINMNTKITLICKSDHTFDVTPKKHMQKDGGCRLCANIKTQLRCRSTKDIFIEKARNIHKDIYDYTDVVYTNNNTKVTIKCAKHGPFLKTPQKHLSGQGCNKCKANYSKISIQWLNYWAVSFPDIQHAENIGEYKIPHSAYRVDGFSPSTQTVFEFNGDLYHANPRFFKPDELNRKTGKLNRFLQEKTDNKLLALADKGYEIIHIWEYDWKRAIDCVRILQQRWKIKRNKL